MLLDNIKKGLFGQPKTAGGAVCAEFWSNWKMKKADVA